MILKHEYIYRCGNEMPMNVSSLKMIVGYPISICLNKRIRADDSITMNVMAYVYKLLNIFRFFVVVAKTN